jgi:ligand-binding sensor domain-containing protein/serine phosphatase RsbU (regulator of sigma subunit)
LKQLFAISTILITLLGSINLNAQNQRFKSLSIKEGLSQSTVNCIIQDKKGFIWVGTQDGLNKYDGGRFIHYKNIVSDSNSIPDNNIQALFEDSYGKIWIGTYGGGVAVYNSRSNQFKRFHSTNSGLTDDITMCFTELNGSIYIGTKRGGLNIYDETENKISPVKIENNTNLQIRDITKFNNKIYVATNLGGIHYADKSVWVKLLDTVQIQVIKPIKNKLWLGGLNGEVYYKESDYFKFNKLNIKGLSQTGIWGMVPGDSTSIWAGTFGDGLLKINIEDNKVVNKFISQKEDPNSLSHDVILTLFKDREGGIWIGTLGGGVNYFEPENQKFQHYNDLNGLSNNVVMSFLKDTAKLYVGTYGGGLNILDFNTNTFSSVKEIKANIIRCMHKDNNGIIWIGTYGNGLIRYNPKKHTSKQVLKNVTDDVWNIISGNENEIWLGTWGSGLIKLNTLNLEHKQYKKDNSINSIGDDIVLSIAKNKDGNIWIGTYGSGLNYLNTNTNQFKHFGSSGVNNKETNNKKIRNILINKDGNLLLGTDGGGLNIYNSKKNEFEYVTKENGLPNNVVYGIAQENENIWITTNYGIAKYSLTKKTITNFDYDDGLQNNEFNQGALYFNSDKIYAGGINGFNIFNPKKTELISKNAPTIITSMKVMGLEHNPPIQYVDSINLHYSSNFLSFQFSYLDYSGKTVYRCKLEGLDNDWLYLDERNYINYTNLPPGKYTLKYQGKRTGEWNNNYSTLPIIIPPPFWKTIWFYSISIIFILISLYLFYLFKQKSLIRKNLELENQVKKRTNEIQLKNISLEDQKREIELQKELAETKNSEIQASITYAKRIQSAILPPLSDVKKNLPNSFILYKPKDIVAGDFYWMEQVESKILFAAADCTGHGVPGAMVSVICNNALNRSVREYNLTSHGYILNKSREIVIQEFEKSDEEVRDGMDIALCSIEGNKLQYAGAHNPLWIIRNGELLETKGNKQPIGQFRKSDPFTTHTLELQKGDSIYVFSDGYVDQFGGEKGKKFMAKAFRELLLSIQDKSMEEQKTLIDNVFETWRGNLEQIDDVCVIGVRI